MVTILNASLTATDSIGWEDRSNGFKGKEGEKEEQGSNC